MLRQRMYHLVMYNISQIQQGIQCYHAGMEYALHFWSAEEFKQWINKDKTVIILNGGTSNQIGCSVYDVMTDKAQFGSMEKHYAELQSHYIDCVPFYEPDLNNALSAVAFLCDEMVWDKEKYPDPDFNPRLPAQMDLFKAELERLYGERTAFLRIFLLQLKLA